jgi:hypothetical protein
MSNLIQIFTDYPTAGLFSYYYKLFSATLPCQRTTYTYTMRKLSEKLKPYMRDWVWTVSRNIATQHSTFSHADQSNNNKRDGKKNPKEMETPPKKKRVYYIATTSKFVLYSIFTLVFPSAVRSPNWYDNFGSFVAYRHRLSFIHFRQRKGSNQG